MTVYADYAFYTYEYLKGRQPVIPEPEFKYWSRMASQYITNRINKELTVDDDLYEQVQLCCCELAEKYFSSDSESKKVVANIGKKSEKVGEYSVTYAESTQNADTVSIFNAAINEILYRYLANTGLLFRGVW